MKAHLDQITVDVSFGDITLEKTDAIVNAAHPDLRGGAGVDAAIHLGGGPKILEECIQIGGCPVGGAVITTGGDLPSRFVIHTVGPEYDPETDQADLLSLSYLNCLRIAAAYCLKSLSFCAVSTGAFCYPKKQAALIAVETVCLFLEKRPHTLELIRFLLYREEQPEAMAFYREAMLQLEAPWVLA